MASLRADCTFGKCNLEVPLGESQPFRQSDGRRVVAVSHCTRGRQSEAEFTGIWFLDQVLRPLKNVFEESGALRRGTIPVVGIVGFTTRLDIAERPGSRQGTPRPNPNVGVKVAVRRGSLRGRLETDPECQGDISVTSLFTISLRVRVRLKVPRDLTQSGENTCWMNERNQVDIDEELRFRRLSGSGFVSFVETFLSRPGSHFVEQGWRQSIQRFDTSGCVKVAE